MEDKEQIKPLAVGSPSIYEPNRDEEAAAGWRSSQFLRKRRGALWCCGCCGLIVVVLGLVILILALTVFKVKDPVLTLNDLHIYGVDAGPRDIDDPRPISVNVTLTADISINNPNIASFRFDNSTTEFYYSGKTLGVAYAPSGQVKARRTLRMNATVDVLADRVAAQPNATWDLFLDGGELNMTTFTDLSGRVNVLGIYKRDVEVMVNCSVTVVTSPAGIKNKVCTTTVS